jgi:hypothetical protein
VDKSESKKKLKDTSTSASITKQLFRTFSTLSESEKESYKHTRILPIPVAIDEYSRFIGGVDIADQLWAGFSTH